MIAVFLLVIAVYIEKITIKAKSYELNIEKVEKKLHQKEYQLEKVIDSIQYQLTNDGFRKLNHILISDKNYNYLKKQGFSILIYKDDSLKFWTNNSIEVNELYSESNLNNRIAKLNNAWYEIITEKQNNYFIIGLLHLKNKYTIQNKFLKNDFPDDFNLPASVQISMIPLSYSFDIKDKDNNYIFSFVPTNTIQTTNLNSELIGFLYLLSICLIILFLNQILLNIYNTKQKFWQIYIILISVVLIRILMLNYKVPVSLYSINFFDPQHFARSGILPSLGDFFINVVILIFIIIQLNKLLAAYRISKFVERLNNLSQTIIAFVIIIAVFLLFFITDFFIDSLIINSKITFEFQNITSLNSYSLLGIMIISGLLFSAVYVVDKLIGILKDIIQIRKFMLFVLILIISISIYLIFNNQKNSVISLALFSVISLIIFFIRKKESGYNYYKYVLIIVFFSIYSIFLIYTNSDLKKFEESKVLVTKLANERDPVAELLLSEIEKSLNIDDIIYEYARKNIDIYTVQKIKEYLQKQYFDGYWNKYELSVDICSSSNNENTESCTNKYIKTINNFGIKLENSNYYFLDNMNGSISYLCILRYNHENNFLNIYINLNTKLIPQELGYPELLLDQQIKPLPISKYSYAKYQNGRLMTKSGDYQYDLSNESMIIDTDVNIYQIEKKDYLHTVFLPDNENSIVLSYKKTTFIDYLIAFSYVFVFYNLFVLLYQVITNPLKNLLNFKINFKQRLLFSMIFILLLSFVLVGGGAALYNLTQYQKKHNENIKEKTQSVLINLEQTYDSTLVPNSKWTKNEKNDNTLKKISNVFFSDINLYSPEGDLLTTSRPEIFEEGLIGTKMNQEALRQILIKSKSEYIQKEMIGEMEYSSAYIPFFDKNKKLVAIINLPYFTKPSILQEETTDLLVTIINFYVVLFLLTIIIAVIVSERIISPLKLIQNKFRKIELGKKHEKIEYKGNDEIGDLISEYNRMVEKLEESIELLAKSERESAWREMAKQIAHEIKNPLTPMKLSIQFLIRSWENKDEDFNQKIKKVSSTLIDQIDTLSKIATEFSAFAKMPKPTEEVIDLIEKLENIVHLYRNMDNTDILLEHNGLEDVYVIADKEQLSRVFINLIKNAIQSIPDGIKGKIKLVLNKKDDQITVTIKDNGSGIPKEVQSKLFTPSFTTKTSGMGLGLSIVKNIVTNFKGDIWFDSELGKGSSFFVQLPIQEKN